MLFKYLGGVDAVPICLRTQDPEEIIRNLKMDAGYYNYNKRTLFDFFRAAREQGLGAAARNRLSMPPKSKRALLQPALARGMNSASAFITPAARAARSGENSFGNFAI